MFSKILLLHDHLVTYPGLIDKVAHLILASFNYPTKYTDKVVEYLDSRISHLFCIMDTETKEVVAAGTLKPLTGISRYLMANVCTNQVYKDRGFSEQLVGMIKLWISSQIQFTQILYACYDDTEHFFRTVLGSTMIGSESDGLLWYYLSSIDN
jgi:hypothetical protein